MKTDWIVESEIRFKTEWEGQIFEQWGVVIRAALVHEIIGPIISRFSLKKAGELG